MALEILRERHESFGGKTGMTCWYIETKTYKSCDECFCVDNCVAPYKAKEKESSK